MLNDEEIEILRKEIESNKVNHTMLGYSFFIQEDP